MVTLQSLIDATYPGLNSGSIPLAQYFLERSILASCNDDVDNINEVMIHQFPGQLKEFHSADKVVIEDGADKGSYGYPTKYLNSIRAPGTPLHKLQIKIGCPLMIMRNINPAIGLCNGT